MRTGSQWRIYGSPYRPIFSQFHKFFGGNWQNIGAFPLELAISSTGNYGYTIDDLKNMIYESFLHAYYVSLFCNEQNIFPRKDKKNLAVTFELFR